MNINYLPIVSALSVAVILSTRCLIFINHVLKINDFFSTFSGLLRY